MRVILLVFSLSLISGYIIPDESTEELRRSVYSQMAKNIYTGAIHYMGPDRGIGVVATRDVKREEPVAAIPAKFIFISFDEYPFRSYLTKGGQPLLLIGRLVYEKFVNRSNAWDNLYARTIPSEINTIFNWTSVELEYLSSSIPGGLHLNIPLDYAAGWKIYNEGLSRYPGIQHLCPACLEKDVYTWAYGNLLSRAYDISKAVWKELRGLNAQSGDENIKGAVYIPILDLVNHGPIPLKYKNQPGNVGLSFQIQGTPGAVLLSERDIQAGTEILWSYGEKRNMELYISYGFYIKDNIDEYSPISVEMTENCLEVKMPQQNRCLFKLRVYELNKNMLYMIRKTYASDLDLPILANESEILSYYVTLDDTAETKNGLVTSILQYHHATFDRQGSTCTIPFREVSRKLKQTSTNKRIKDVDMMCYESHKAIFKHMRLSDRLSLKILYRELGMISRVFQ